jgi:hypothetical protein
MAHRDCAKDKKRLKGDLSAAIHGTSLTLARCK